MNILYPAIIKKLKRDDRYFVHFPQFEEAITEGQTLHEALSNAAEVLTLTLEGRIDENMLIPLPSKRFKNAYLIAPAAHIQAALLILFNKSTKKLSDKASVTQQHISRPHSWPSLRQLERTASELGQRLIISLEPFN